MTSILKLSYTVIVKILAVLLVTTGLLLLHYRAEVVSKANTINELETAIHVKDQIQHIKTVEHRLESINLMERAKQDEEINYDVGTHSINIK